MTGGEQASITPPAERCDDAASLAARTLTVSGGAGGTIARLDDLLAAHRGLAEAAFHLRAAGSRLRGAQRCAANAVTPPAYEARRVAAVGDLDRLAVGPGGAWALQIDVASAASRLEATAQAMVAAERNSGTLWRALARLGSMGARALGAAFDGDPGAAIDALNPGRDAVEAAVGASGRSGDAAATVALLGVAAVGAVTGRPDGVMIAAQQTTDREAPATTADIVQRIADLEPRNGGTPSTIAIERIVGADGSVAWIVEVPGTQAWADVRGPNLMDLEANLRLEAGGTAAPAAAVALAMNEAGIPPGEPVMFVGHSQGGMTALALASDPGLAAHYDVRAVVTAGTPAAGFELPEGVHALHLEHAEDVVPGLDGAPNPGGATQLTVSRPLEASADPDEAGAVGVAEAHRVERYVATAEAVGASDHPSIEAWERATAPFTSGVSSEWTQVMITRAD